MLANFLLMRSTFSVQTLLWVGQRRGDPEKPSDTMARKKILLVDDSETVLMMERLILQNECYEVETAKDGKEGIAKAVETKPDLILMDVVMPHMNGFEAVKRLRQRDETKSVPIVMVTTQAEMDSMEAGYVSGCSDYVVKPIDHLELLTKVKNLIGE